MNNPATIRFSPFDAPVKLPQRRPRVSGPYYQAHSDTSRQAGGKIKISSGTLRKRILDYLVRCKHRGATDKEIQAALGLESCTQVPRRKELQDAGLVKDSDTTRRNKSGRRAVVWVAV